MVHIHSGPGEAVGGNGKLHLQHVSYMETLPHIILHKQTRLPSVHAYAVLHGITSVNMLFHINFLPLSHTGYSLVEYCVYM